MSDHLLGLRSQAVGVQVVSVAQLVGLPLEEQAGLLIRRALLCKANNQTFAAFANWLHAAKVLPSKPPSASCLVASAAVLCMKLLLCS